jgi:transposase
MVELIAPNMDMQPQLSRNGKRLWSKAQKRVIVGEAMRSGTSVSVLSRRYDINANLIFRWMKLAGFETENKQQLIPVGVIAPPSVPPSKRDQTTNASPKLPVGTPKLIEIELRDGTKVRIDGDVRLPVLQSVLKMVRGLT